jgi:hypothetical protein
MAIEGVSSSNEYMKSTSPINAKQKNNKKVVSDDNLEMENDLQIIG